MKFVAPTEPYRKSGGMGHPGICGGQEMRLFISRGSATPSWLQVRHVEIWSRCQSADKGSDSGYSLVLECFE